MITLIKLNNIDKYYNKSKSNELHVIDNISLELPKTGFVTILGRSGSGKSTLLNIVGGLDRAKGKITYDGLEVNDYEMQKVDLYRQKHISYVFQNYLLIDELSIYDNLKVALEFIGVFDTEEQKKRIEYVLKAVGLYKYRKKHADKLSGGQMQRVSIARALLKDSKIIIADEPTGNLDSENSFEVMNILKRISKKTLVLLVTHNNDIAKFYSDRIIQMKDGRIISDEENDGNETLNHQSDHKIHLLDYQKTELTDEKITINLYSNSDKPVQLNVVVKNDTIYIDSKQKLKIVDGVDIELINDHYQEIKKEELENYNFDISWYQDDKKHKTKFFHYLKTALFSFFRSSNKAKVFHIIFIIIGVILAFCTISLVNYTSINDREFSNQDKVVIITDNTDFYYPSYDPIVIEEAIKNGYITEVYNYSQYYLTSHYYLNSHRSSSCNFDSFTYPYSLAQELIIGNEPSESKVVIGSDLADLMIDAFKLDLSYENLIGATINSGYTEYEICGISKGSNSIYFNDDYYYGSYFYLFDYYDEYEKDILLKDIKNVNLSLSSGVMPQNNYEVVANSDTYHIGDTVNGLKVVGLSNEVDSNVMYTDTVSRLKYYFNIFGYEYNPTLSFAITENSMQFFEDNGLIIITPYELMYTYEEEMLRDSQLTNIIFIIILFVFSLIYIYFSIRSKLINQIKVIGIYRSIGATRSQISFVYLARIIVQTTLTSVIGYVVVCVGYSFIAIKLASLGGNILFNTNFVPFYLFLGLVVLYLSHILFGLIPVWNLMRKTPAEINSKYDI